MNNKKNNIKFLNELTSTEYVQFIENLVILEGKSLDSFLESEAFNSFQEFMMGGFEWRLSEQGNDYWFNISLRGLSQANELRQKEEISIKLSAMYRGAKKHDDVYNSERCTIMVTFFRDGSILVTLKAGKVQLNYKDIYDFFIDWQYINPIFQN